jgi:hypothetical protein
MFFFKAAALASLLFSTTSAHSTKKGDNVATSSVKKVGKGVSTVKKVDNVGASRVSKKALKKQLNAQIRQKLAVTKLEKLAKLKTKASTVNLETTTFDEPAHNKMHMRGLKMKNNFLVMTVFDDAECMTPTMQYGTLVNYCMNEEGDEGGKRSYITKLNKKENLAVDIQFDGFDCKVSLNISSLSHFCFNCRESLRKSPICSMKLKISLVGEIASLVQKICTLPMSISPPIRILERPLACMLRQLTPRICAQPTTRTMLNLYNFLLKLLGFHLTNVLP